jgi:hypothetical protein
MANIGERVIDGCRAPAGYEQLAVSATAVSPALVPPPTDTRPGATAATISVEAGDIRYRDDGSDPTSSVGMPLKVDVPFFYTGDPSKLRFIRQSSDAVVNLLYYY